MKSRAFALASITAVICAGFFARSGTAAESVEEFYRGKTLNIYISSGEGGANDSYARLIAGSIGRYIPGNPAVIPRNMPGAGGLKATNYLYDIAAKDGTVYGVVQRGIIIQPLVDIQSATFDPSKFNWIGSTAREVSVGVVWTAGTDIRSIEDAKKKVLAVGSSGIGNDTGGFPLVLNYFLGTQFKPIHGYKSGSEIILALERGEVQGRIGWSWGSVKSRSLDWLHDGKIKILVQMGVEKSADMPDVPLAIDLANSPEDREAMKLIFSPTYIGWPSVMPPGVPMDRVQAIRAAYDKTMRDPEFISAAAKQSLELDPLGGEVIQELVSQLYALPASVVDRARMAMNAR